MFHHVSGVPGFVAPVLQWEKLSRVGGGEGMASVPAHTHTRARTHQFRKVVYPELSCTNLVWNVS